jgi:UDP-glucuronate decarboxylase
MNSNPILIQDFESVYSSLGGILEVMKNKKLLITGSSGMIGSCILSFFSHLNETYKFNIEIVGLSRSVPRFKLSGVTYLQGDVSNITIEGHSFHYIIHAASLASPIYYGSQPIETLLPNVLGTINLLKLAERCPLECFLFISSSEVYGSHAEELEQIEESDYGAIDPLKLRSCYAESKRMGENLCASWHHQKKIPVKIVRPFHTYGPGLKRNDGRVFADFIYNAVDNLDINLTSKGEARRAFCYLADALEAILLVLVKGEIGEAYNVGNPSQEVSIFDFANKVKDLDETKTLKLTVIEREDPLSYIASKVTKNTPSIKKISVLGWFPKTDLNQGLKRTIEFIKISERGPL